MVSKNLSLPEEVIYSTHPEFEAEYASIREPDTLSPIEQEIFISLEKRNFDCATVTKVTGFIGKRIDLLSLSDELQQVCHTEGATRMHEIVLCGDVRKRVYVYLRNRGFGVNFADSKA